MTRDAFEYRLHTITSRSEEAQFQRFVHAILEVEICPNLVPQTGPTGGGDSKVDAETYAVSDSISERWWSGTAREAAAEQWAFAISAMKDWRKKARSDIDNVIASERDYKRIYFVTNQFVKDKDRAKLEKELSARALNTPVRILDRTWILQAVFDHSHWPIAERELGLSSLDVKAPKGTGPLDSARTRQLAEVEREIADPARFANSPLQLAQAWLTSALLARGLGRSRDEIDQRFDRSIEAARRSGNSRCERRMIYQKSWTAYWWFDDFTAVIGGYAAIEALLDEETNSWDLEQLTNLYTLLYSAERHSWIPAGTAHLDELRERLLERLAPLASRLSHPTDAAWAQTHVLHLSFLSDPASLQKQMELVKGLKKLLKEAERLPEYPVESLCEVIAVFSRMPLGIEGLDTIADRAGELVGQRIGAQAQAQQLLDRASHKVNQKLPEDALRLLGRALSLLHRQPSRELYLEGAWIAAQAYCDVGLFCAARAHLLLGLNRSLRSIVENAEISSSSLAFALRLAWVELASGRLPLMLEALRHADLMAMALDLSESGREQYLNERSELEILLARSIAASSRIHSAFIQAAPAALKMHQLHLAERVTLELLGQVQHEASSADHGLDLKALQTSPWPSDVGVIDWESSATGTVRSRVLGCELTAFGTKTREARSLAMAVFAALEGFAATAFSDRLAAGNDRVALVMDDSSRSKTLSISVEEDDCGDSVIHVRFARGTLSEYAGTGEFRRKAVEVVTRIIANASMPHARDVLERMLTQDAAQDRSFGLLSSCLLDDLSIEEPTLDSLRPSECPYSELISQDKFLPDTQSTTSLWNRNVNMKDASPGALNFHHQRTRRVGAINEALWNRAGWNGVGFAGFEDAPPEMYLLFKDEDAGMKIMRGWHRRAQDRTADQILCIAIITDVSKEHRATYRIGIAPATANSAANSTETLMITLRSNTMTPTTSTNLDSFLESYRKHGSYRLGAAIAPTDARFPFVPLDVEPIELRSLQVQPAWQIKKNDIIFSMMVRADDDPYIPPQIQSGSELPVVQAIADARARKKAAR